METSFILFVLTCYVTGDPGSNFFKFIWKISSRPLRCRLKFSATSIGYWDTGGHYSPPPAEGRGRTRPSRARVNPRGDGVSSRRRVAGEVNFAPLLSCYLPNNWFERNAGSGDGKLPSKSSYWTLNIVFRRSHVRTRSVQRSKVRVFGSSVT